MRVVRAKLLDQEHTCQGVWSQAETTRWGVPHLVLHRCEPSKSGIASSTLALLRNIAFIVAIYHFHRIVRQTRICGLSKIVRCMSFPLAKTSRFPFLLLQHFRIALEKFSLSITITRRLFSVQYPCSYLLMEKRQASRPLLVSFTQIFLKSDNDREYLTRHRSHLT